MAKSKLKKELLQENEILLNRLNRLEAMLMNNDKTKEDTKEEGTIIPMHKIIKVVSLYHGVLNLKTSSSDQTTIFKFNHFGDEQPIFYSDLVKAISIQQRFFKDGFCMILDKEVVKAHYLTDAYKNLLNREQIEGFLDFSEQEITIKYPKLTEQQKMSVLESIAIKINAKENIDMNKVDVLSSVSKQDLYDLAKKLKQ